MGRRRPRKQRPIRALEADESFDDISEAVAEAIEQRLGGESVEVSVWDIGSDWAVYTVGMSDDLFKVTYARDDAGTVTLGDAVPVDREVVYTPETVTEAVGPAREVVDHIPGRLLEAKGNDTTGGRVFAVQLITAGDSKNGRRYPEAVLHAAVPLYEGAKAFDHHRTEDELRSSTITGLVGSYRNVRPNTVGIEADLHLLSGATHVAEALDASLAAQQAGLPALVGISHDVLVNSRPVMVGGRRFQEATQILQVNSADVVADPAAGGRVTRMVAGGSGDTSESQEDDDMTLKELRALIKSASPDKRAELLTEHAAVLTDAGLTADEFNVLEPATEKKELVGAGVGAAGAGTTETVTESVQRVTEGSYSRSSAMGRMLIRTAVEDANLAAHLVPVVSGQLPEQFTESDLSGVMATAASFQRQYEAAGLTPTVPDVKVTQEDIDKKALRLDAMFAEDYASGGYTSFREAYLDITGYKGGSDVLGEDFNRRILRESFGSGYDSGSRATESVTSTTWNTILGDSITRRMVAEYAQPSLQSWRTVVSSMPPINDFRTQRIERWGGYGVLPAVNEGAPYQPLTSPGNEEATYSLTKRGGTEDLTLETIANDDLRRIQAIPRRLGLAAAQTLYRFVWDLFDSNATCTYDSVALFHASHSNTATNALSQSNLGAAWIAMEGQTAYGDSSNVLDITPKILVVNKSLREIGFQLTQSAVAVPGTPAGPSNTPNMNQGMQLVVVPYWSSSTKWYTIADPAMVPTIEVGFYQGRQDPELFSQTDETVGSPFNSDKIVYKIRHIYSGTPLDHRGVYRGNT